MEPVTTCIYNRPSSWRQIGLKCIKHEIFFIDYVLLYKSYLIDRFVKTVIFEFDITQEDGWSTNYPAYLP